MKKLSKWQKIHIWIGCVSYIVFTVILCAVSTVFGGLIAILFFLFSSTVKKAIGLMDSAGNWVV